MSNQISDNIHYTFKDKMEEDNYRSCLHRYDQHLSFIKSRLLINKDNIKFSNNRILFGDINQLNLLGNSFLNIVTESVNITSIILKNIGVNSDVLDEQNDIINRRVDSYIYNNNIHRNDIIKYLINMVDSCKLLLTNLDTDTIYIDRYVVFIKKYFDVIGEITAIICCGNNLIEEMGSC